MHLRPSVLLLSLASTLLAPAVALATSPAGPGTGLVTPAAAAEPPDRADEDFPEYLGRHLGLSAAAAAPTQSRFHLALLPFVMANPLVGAGGGAAALGGFRLGPPGEPFSRFEASAFATARHQAGGVLRTGIRLPSEGWLLVGDWGAGRFPNPAYGLGGLTTSADRTIVDRRQVQIHETAYRRTASRLFAGLGYDLDLFEGIVDRRAAAGEATGFAAYPFGTGSRSVSSGLSLHLLWDGRDNPVAPRRGQYALVRYRFEPSVLGTDDDWRSVYADARTYFPLRHGEDVLGLWAFAWSSFGNTPYLLLPAVGADPEHRSARGYVEGRFAAKDLAYLEAEYRIHLWQWLGGAVAASLAAPSERGTGVPGPLFRRVHPAIAGGWRVLLDRASGANIALDAAWAPGQGPSFYVNANETF
ncbi:BamA/TamA family outer membrane protein [Anaeromyxobacter oryzae]|uniref:Bacterial surface antigen (D15) domain-containing protein n=1 Tax=Anaeromyxobacter oryzae TaxID=2918170 RepID=A0ABN6MVY1_9BACT|nr:BamA/TamA family outer membrane protein [Anaeromyxobacter oryzae]BDG05119.1 hypothetical protein AMOR_41150 [Anaeromyxobacter oryzae]